MKITADANLLVRIVVRDDAIQARVALAVLEEAHTVYVPLPCLCEFAWVLGRTYRLSRAQIGPSIRAIVERGNVVTDLVAVRTGLKLLDSGGDFADGVIAAVGAEMGSDRFVSFDRNAVARLLDIGIRAELLKSP